MSWTTRSLDWPEGEVGIQTPAALAGALIASRDWGSTPLGPRKCWPVPLETLVQVMLGASQPMCVAWGPERTLLYNDPYAGILGVRHPDAMGRPLLDVWADIRDDLEPIVDRVYQGEPVTRDDITLLLHRSGYQEETHVSFSFTPVRNQTAEVAGLFCAGVETSRHARSARKLAELKLAEAATAIENMAEGFIILASDFRIRQINAEGLRIDGRPANQIVGRHLLDVWPEAEHLPTWPAYQRAMQERTPVELVYRHQSDTHDVWLEVRAYPVTDGLAVFYRDVTERFTTERMLRDTAERVQLALDAGAIVGTWVWHVPGNKFTADERFADAFGLDPVLCRDGVPLDRGRGLRA